MTKRAITHQRVLDLIDAYGAQPGAWPDEDRDAALAVIAAEPAVFAAALDDARQLDQAFESAPLIRAPRRLADAVLAAAPRAAPQTGARKRGWAGLFGRRVRLPAGAALASLACGLVAGYSYAGDRGPALFNDEDAALTYAVEDSFDVWLDAGEDQI